jgi:hypothetical protein
MPNKRGDGRLNLQSWVDAQLGEAFKAQAKSEGVHQNELLTRILESYLKQQNEAKNPNSSESPQRPSDED